MLGFLFVGVLMTIAKEFLGGLPAVLPTADLLFDWHCDPRQFLRAHSCSLGKEADMLIELLHLQLLRELLKKQQKHDIVRENDRLPRLGFLNQPPRNSLTPLIVERRHRIIEDDA